MNSLREMQVRFLRHISGQQEDASHLIESTPRLRAEDRLRIYAHAYFKRLRDVVDEDYPCLGLLLGDDGFEQLAEAFIRDHPSQHPSIRWYSDALPDWLASRHDYARYPVLIEMARWEQRLRRAFDGPNCEHSPLSSLQLLQPEQWPHLCLQLISTYDLHRHEFNTVRVWQALRDGEQPPPISELTAPEYWIIWRPDLRTQFRSLATDEAQLLIRAQQGENFAMLCESLVDWHGDNASMRAAQLLQAWFQEGLVKAWYLD